MSEPRSLHSRQLGEKAPGATRAVRCQFISADSAPMRFTASTATDSSGV